MDMELLTRIWEPVMRSKHVSGVTAIRRPFPCFLMSESKGVEATSLNASGESVAAISPGAFSFPLRDALT